MGALKNAGLLQGGIELGSVAIMANEEKNKQNDYLGENAINSVFNTSDYQQSTKNNYSNFFWNYEYIIFGAVIIALIIYLKKRK